MKAILWWFCIGFATFFIGGGIVGYLSRVPSEDEIDLVAVRHTAIAIKDDHLVLAYLCGSHEYFDFFLHDEWLKADNDLLEHPVVPKPLSWDNFETILLAASGWELRDLVVTATGISLTAKEKVALAIGSVSGFNAGRWLFSTALPACNSGEVLARLQKPEYWKNLKHQKCKQMCLRYRLFFPLWSFFSTKSNPPIVTNYEPLRKALGAFGVSADQSAMIDELDRLEKTFRSASSSDGKIDVEDFNFIAGEGPNLLYGLYQHPNILKEAFQTRYCQLRFVLNDSPEVVKREVHDRLVTLNFATSDEYERNLGGIWSVEIAVLCIVAIFIIGAIGAALSLLGDRVFKRLKRA